MKKVLGVYSAPRGHWVGDGFPVRSLFSYQSHGKQLSPFLLLDRAGPAEFTPTEHLRGVGQHPHRGFETVTIVYQGEVAHRDSTGRGGVIGPGDVQWMTAGGGILHEEFHSEAFARRGGTLDMVQLWVNLPARDKMTEPGYQAIRDAEIPRIALLDDAGAVRVIAGEFAGHAGPARTFSPMHVWDLQLRGGALSEWTVPTGWNTSLVVLKGTVEINGATLAREAQLVVFDPAERVFTLEAAGDASVLLLSGEPIDEPIVGYGPFVMNDEAQIAQAIDDFNSGRFGRMDH
ncbi:pirin family protein [Chitiniphilus eburneus]|uniref:Pirin family protein n=1 Tax=Chitiniphilus eburneus TaxID=2571148 RepID=A0A4U0PTL1_9NEIS|nr:pirin family protein [Chitiniphilus eburneus]TJZ71709.1 pirin family protein [Chitiniphilus eburneus]